VLRDLKAGAISDNEAIERLERSLYWIWTAMDPDSKLLLGIDVGTRTLEMAQREAAVGRRVNTLCQDEDGLCQQLVVFHVYYNFYLPHASLRQPLLVPEATNGSGSAKRWRPCTHAMAAGLTDHVWSLKEVLLYRVPPWPQPQTV